MAIRLLMVVAIYTYAHGLGAAEPSTKTVTDQDLVQEALRVEIEGNSARREQLLEQASIALPNEPLVHWMQGEIRNGKKWKPYEEVVREAKDSPVLQQYRELRDASEATLASQLKLANYCRSHNLKGQAEAHWSAIIELEPDHLESRQQLSFTKVDGRWIKKDELNEVREKSKQVAQTLARLRPSLLSLVAKLESNQLSLAEASEQLSAAAEPAAIPAWEAIVSPASPKAALAVVQALGKMKDPEASLALTRHALASNWSEVRSKAVEFLKERDFNSFVPALLGELQGPWVGWRELVKTNQDQLVYRFTAIADGLDQQSLRVLDQAYFLHGARPFAARDANQLAQQASNQLESVRLLENERINARNSLIMKLLADIAGEKTFDSPQDWWQWWDDRNEVYTTSAKPLEKSYAFRRSDVVGIAPPPQPRSSGGRSTSESKKDCLAAGTPILTQRGPIPIERIRIGDLVLAKHPESGEIDLKPVLRTTMREPEPLVRISLGDGNLRASGGHLFWVSGTGWVRARLLKPDMQLHGYKGAVKITAVETEEKPTRTFNLIVADFHTYFAGSNHLLSHDNTPSIPTKNVVPGLLK